jgi:hypothetical protein
MAVLYQELDSTIGAKRLIEMLVYKVAETYVKLKGEGQVDDDINDKDICIQLDCRA